MSDLGFDLGGISLGNIFRNMNGNSSKSTANTTGDKSGGGNVSSGTKRKWRPEEERTRKLSERVRVDDIKQQSGRERFHFMERMNEHKMYSKKFLDWVWPHRLADKVKMTEDYPELVNGRFHREYKMPDGTKKMLVDPAARFAIDHWFGYGCHEKGILTGIPNLQGKYKASTDPNADLWIGGTPPWFQTKKDGHFKGQLKVADLPEAERTRVCKQLQTQFQPGGWKAIDVKALWKKFIEQHGEPTATEVKEWHALWKQKVRESKTAVLDKKLLEDLRKQVYSQDADSLFSAAVRKAVYDYAKELSETEPLKNYFTNAFMSTGGMPDVIPFWEKRYTEIEKKKAYRDRHTQYILETHPEWGALPAASVVSAQDKKTIEALKHILKTNREHYFLHETYTGRDLLKIIEEREGLLKKLKHGNAAAMKKGKNNKYNKDADDYMNKLYTAQYYSSVLALPNGPERKRQSDLYEFDKYQKVGNFVGTKGYSKHIHVAGSAMNVEKSLEAARAIGRKNYDAVRKFAAFALEKKQGTRARPFKVQKKNGTFYTMEELREKKRKYNEAKKKKEDEKKKKEDEEKAKLEEQRQRNLNIERKRAQNAYLEGKRRQKDQSQARLQLDSALLQKANAAKRKREEREAEFARIQAEGKRKAEAERQERRRTQIQYPIDSDILREREKQNRLERG